MPEIIDPAHAARRLLQAHRIAVLGASQKRHRAGFYVADYLHQHGYRILPVNPALVGTQLWGEPVRANLGDLTEAIDVVDVFRRSELLAAHLPELLALRPKLVWFQLGIRDDEVCKALVDAGIDVVQDRCALADHRRFGPAVAR